MHDAAGRPRDPPALPTHRQQPAARVSRLPWVPPTPPASSPRHLSGERCPPGIDATFLQPTGCMPRPVRGVSSTRSISGLSMDTITRQDRITLKNLKVADFASEETLCFTATVMFDGRPIAEARNDGHGGSTFVRALQGQAALLAQAEEFAKSLPPASLDVEREDDEPLLIDMTLDFLVDQLADAMHAERKLRTAFNRDIGNKVLFIRTAGCCSSRASSSRPLPNARHISQSCAADRTSPSSSWPSCQRTRHSPSGSSMSWATSPADPASPHRHDRPALVAGLFLSLRTSIGAGPDADFQLTWRGTLTKLSACSLIRQHMPAARVSGCRGVLSAQPTSPHRIHCADARPQDADAFQPRAELPSREGQGPAFPRAHPCPSKPLSADSVNWP